MSAFNLRRRDQRRRDFARRWQTIRTSGYDDLGGRREARMTMTGRTATSWVWLDEKASGKRAPAAIRAS
jgi:hypothetical protein